MRYDEIMFASRIHVHLLGTVMYSTYVASSFSPLVHSMKDDLIGGFCRKTVYPTMTGIECSQSYKLLQSQGDNNTKLQTSTKGVLIHVMSVHLYVRGINLNTATC